jgi:hypothetical protein
MRPNVNHDQKVIFARLALDEELNLYAPTLTSNDIGLE